MKKIALVNCCLIALLAFNNSLFAQPKQQVLDKIAAIVGDKIVLKSEIENEILDRQRRGEPIPDNANCLLLEQILATKAMALQAERDSIPVSDEEVDAEIENKIRYFVNVYGSKDELEKVAGKSVFQLKEDYKQTFKEQKLVEGMRRKIVEGIKITPTEAKNYFEKIPTDSLPFYESELEIGQIVIYPKPNREVEKYVIDELAGYKQEVESGKKKFDILAGLNSDDPGSKDKGGQFAVNRNEKTIDPTFLSACFRLKEGQVSPVIKSKFGYHIIQLLSRSGDDAVVRHILKIPQISSIEIAGAVGKLDSIKSKLEQNKLDFGYAVNKYSDDEQSKFTGGMLSSRDGTTYLTYDQLEKDMVPVLKKLTVGNYSYPTIFVDERGKKGVKLVFLKTKTNPHRENLKDDFSKVANRALEEKKLLALQKWFDKNIPNNYLMIDEEYINCSMNPSWLNTAQKYKNL
jgi:peptidyl-prolyl cis-trans isomerase SurA